MINKTTGILVEPGFANSGTVARSTCTNREFITAGELAIDITSLMDIYLC